MPDKVEKKFRFWDGKEMHHPENNYAYQLRWLRSSGWVLWWIWDGFEKEIWAEFGENSQYPMMQYNGLMDKHGKERCDGDIIKRSTGYMFEEKMAWHSLGGGNNASVFGYNFHPDDEIIGNIFANPELLK